MNFDPHSINAKNPNGQLGKALAEYCEVEEILNNTVATLSDRKREARSVVARLREMNGTESNFSALSLRYNGLRREICGMQNAIQCQRQTLERRRVTIENVLISITATRERLNAARARIQKYKREIDKLQRQIKALETGLADAHREAVALEDKLEAIS